MGAVSDRGLAGLVPARNRDQRGRNQLSLRRQRRPLRAERGALHHAARAHARPRVHRAARPVALFVVGAVAHELAPHGWNDIDLAARWRNHGPTFAGGHLAGTDNIGRDVLVRTLWGLHYTEQTALVGALLATLLGVTVGGLAGMTESTSSGIGRFNLLALGWWVWTTPAIVLVAILVSTNLVGDGLDAALNPRRPR